MLASQVFFKGRIACPDLSGELACFRLRRIMGVCVYHGTCSFQILNFPNNKSWILLIFHPANLSMFLYGKDFSTGN